MLNKAVMTGISLTEYERNIVQAESERRGLYNFSSTLRQIIREWATDHDFQLQPNPVDEMVAELRASLPETQEA